MMGRMHGGTFRTWDFAKGKTRRPFKSSKRGTGIHCRTQVYIICLGKASQSHPRTQSSCLNLGFATSLYESYSIRNADSMSPTRLSVLCMRNHTLRLLSVKFPAESLEAATPAWRQGTVQCIPATTIARARGCDCQLVFKFCLTAGSCAEQSITGIGWPTR